jgi:3,4-dihydroxy 2-butanone 4-phosphate synthase
MSGMFTGRIGEIGGVIGVTGTQIVVRAPKSAGRLRPGGSLTVAGVCLTAEDITDGQIVANLSEETRRRTTFDRCTGGERVNVETALALGDPLDGHLVQGHVDAVGKVAGIDAAGTGRRIWIRPPDRFLRRVVAKGSIAVDGVSLTVAEVLRDRFSVVLIPATLQQTTLDALAPGDRVNLESDLVAAGSPAPAADIARAVGSLGWAGQLSGRVGVEKTVTQLAAGGGVMVWDPVPLENRIWQLTCRYSGCQAACTYSLIRPLRTGFRRICPVPGVVWVAESVWRSLAGTRWAMPWWGRAVL